MRKAQGKKKSKECTVQSRPGHSGTDRKEGILGMQGQKSAEDKIKNGANIGQEHPARKRREASTPVSAIIIPSSSQFLFKLFLCFV